MAGDREPMQPDERDPREAVRVRLSRRVALMLEHVQAIGGLLRELQAALDLPTTTSIEPSQVKALQDVSEILRECQQLAFSNASELIREMEHPSAEPGGRASDEA